VKALPFRALLLFNSRPNAHHLWQTAHLAAIQFHAMWCGVSSLSLLAVERISHIAISSERFKEPDVDGRIILKYIPQK